jgi:hypothetical protein
MGDQAYSIALGTLSDYEASDTIPRHLHKIFSLCALYAIDFRQYICSAGLLHRSLCQMPPFTGKDTFSAGDQQVKEFVLSSNRSDFPKSLINVCENFIRGKTSQFMSYSAKIGEAHPDGSDYLIVDPSRRVLERGAWPADWQRPLYLIRKCNGNYVYGFCTLSDGMMTVHRTPGTPHPVERFRSDEGTVIGQIVAMSRSLKSSP